jgi:hypothetical protein
MGAQAATAIAGDHLAKAANAAIVPHRRILFMLSYSSLRSSTSYFPKITVLEKCDAAAM